MIAREIGSYKRTIFDKDYDGECFFLIMILEKFDHSLSDLIENYRDIGFTNRAI